MGQYLNNNLRWKSSYMKPPLMRKGVKSLKREEPFMSEFYANKTKKDQREIFLRGRKITCSVSTIEKTLGIPKFRGKCGYSEISEAYNNKTLSMDEVSKSLVRKEPHGGRIHATQSYQLGQRIRF
ncbi:hypothetical protein PIB30_077785 [Stylosanthes scabra]|uniref:Uncharacterized protein n=1 Tax=Stylosanthes scabra TaxID=79078 RepID=A0ABU6SQS9_9FABA|nr:hypothetical protein [Stylosanthes scabra]